MEREIDYSNTDNIAEPDYTAFKNEFEKFRTSISYGSLEPELFGHCKEIKHDCRETALIFNVVIFKI